MSAPKGHLGKRLSSNQNSSVVAITSPPVKRRVKAVQIFKNLKNKKETIKYYGTVLSKNYLKSTLKKTFVCWQTGKYLIKLYMKTATDVKNDFQTTHFYLRPMDIGLRQFKMK